jgi:hypothetical protein
LPESINIIYFKDSDMNTYAESSQSPVVAFSTLRIEQHNRKPKITGFEVL